MMAEAKLEQLKLPKGWTQTDRSAHEAWFELTMQQPRASALMHLLAAYCGPDNTVRLSHKTLKNIMKVKSVTTVKSALATLAAFNFISIVSNAKGGGINEYVLNNHAVWASKREHLVRGKFKVPLRSSPAPQSGKQSGGKKPPSGQPQGNQSEVVDPKSGEPRDPQATVI